jgi:TPR repeat protein
MSKPPRPADAIKHLTSALELAPEDPEIAFNLAAVLESSKYIRVNPLMTADNLDHALSLYKRAAEGGVERAQQNIRNISAKILGKQAKEAEAQ